MARTQLDTQLVKHTIELERSIPVVHAKITILKHS